VFKLQYTLCFKKTSPTFLAVTREIIVGKEGSQMAKVPNGVETLLKISIA